METSCWENRFSVLKHFGCQLAFHDSARVLGKAFQPAQRQLNVLDLQYQIYHLPLFSEIKNKIHGTPTSWALQAERRSSLEVGLISWWERNSDIKIELGRKTIVSSIVLRLLLAVPGSSSSQGFYHRAFTLARQHDRSLVQPPGIGSGSLDPIGAILHKDLPIPERRPVLAGSGTWPTALSRILCRSRLQNQSFTWSTAQVLCEPRPCVRILFQSLEVFGIFLLAAQRPK